MEYELKIGRKVIMDLDEEMKSATLIKLGPSDEIVAFESVHVRLMEYLEFVPVVIDLGFNELNLTLEEQDKICDYILNHTLNNNVYDLTLGSHNNDEDLVCQAIGRMLA